MDNYKKEIQKIVKKLEDDLQHLQFQNNTSALIQISADFKDIKDVIQYFEASIDTLKTQNESLKDILGDYVSDIALVKEKMLDGMVTKQELFAAIKVLSDDLEKVPLKYPMHKRIKKYLNESISPKMLIIAIAIIAIVLAFTFKPDLTKEMLQEFKPVIKVGK